MKERAVWLAAVLACLGAPLVAQSRAGDTIAELLNEVRQLRMTAERAIVVGPQIQLLGARLAVQNDRLARAASEYQIVQRELEEVSARNVQAMGRLQEIETGRRSSLPPEQQRQIEEEETALKHHLGGSAAREARLRGREAELATALSAEQARWAELNRRLDDLERALGPK